MLAGEPTLCEWVCRLDVLDNHDIGFEMEGRRGVRGEELVLLIAVGDVEECADMEMIVVVCKERQTCSSYLSQGQWPKQ